MSTHDILGAFRATGRFFGRIFRFFRSVVSEFAADQCIPRASGLAFASLIALVPLSAVIFSLFSALGTFTDLIEKLQAFFLTIFVPTRQQDIIDYLNRFVNNTKGLGVVGLLMFTVTAVLLLAAIQRTFDSVWGSTTRRFSFRRIVSYLSVLVVGSFLISMALNLTGAVRTMIGTAIDEISVSSSLLFNVFPPLFVFVALVLLITLVPSAYIAVTSALLGSAIGAALWAAAQMIFVFWTNQVIRLSVIYGSLAAIPIFLIWLYVAWMIVLFSLEVTYVHQFRHCIRDARKLADRTAPGPSFLAGLEAFFAVAEAFYDGKKAPTVDELTRSSRLTARELKPVLEALRAGGYLVLAGSKSNRYLPARSLETMPASEAVATIYGAAPNPGGDPEVGDGSITVARALYERITSNAIETLGETTVLDLIKDHRAGKQPEGS